jgi:hypothetical protein
MHHSPTTTYRRFHFQKTYFNLSFS